MVFSVAMDARICSTEARARRTVRSGNVSFPLATRMPWSLALSRNAAVISSRSFLTGSHTSHHTGSSSVAGEGFSIVGPKRPETGSSDLSDSVE